MNYQETNNLEDQPGKIKVSSAMLNVDLSNVKLASFLMDTDSAYIVLPGGPYPWQDNFEEKLIDFLQKSKSRLQNKLVDYTGPFFLDSSNPHDSGYYFGRYLIFDGKLVGIRLNYSEKMNNKKNDYKIWKKGRAISWEIS